MPVMLADYDPGTLTGAYIFFLAALIVIFCLICAGVMTLTKNWRAVRRWMIAAGICIGLAILLICLAISFAKQFHLL